MLRGLIETWPTWMTLPLRVVLGVAFIGHGAQKVFGVWGGPGLAKFAGAEAPYAWMQPGWLWMGAAAFAELLGGVLVLTGLLTRVGALLIMPVMLVAIFGVHWSGGFFITNKPMPGVEYALSVLAMTLALLIAGGGRASFDEALMGPRGRRR
jgi:putative oxidoreductase